MASRPQRTIIAVGAASTMPTAVARLAGHVSTGPRGVAAHSRARQRSRISPGPAKRTSALGRGVRARLTGSPFRADVVWSVAVTLVWDSGDCIGGEHGENNARPSE